MEKLSNNLSKKLFDKLQMLSPSAKKKKSQTAVQCHQNNINNHTNSKTGGDIYNSFADNTKKEKSINLQM